MKLSNVTFPTKFAYDCELRRPACALIQAGMGGNAALCAEFPTSSWLVVPTEALRLYPVADEAMLSKLIAITAGASSAGNQRSDER